MAEKSSELENVNDFPENDTTDYALATPDATEIEASSADITDLETSSTDIDTTDEPEQIRSQIEETRAQMGETIDAIQEKLSFSNISEQVSEQINSAVETAKDAVYDATLGKAGTFMKNLGNELSNTSVVQTARNNPLPFVLIGLGVGLLAYNGFGSKRRTTGSGSSYGYSSQGGKSTLKSATETVSGAASSAAGTVTDAASSAYGTVSNAAGTAAGKVTNVASSAYEGVGNFAGTAREKVGEIGSQAREQYDYHIEENPLAVGAVALAIGAAVGFSIPSTHYEGNLMGETRQNLLEKAQESASTLVDKVKQVADEAQKTIGEEVKAQGLIGDDTGKSGTAGNTGSFGAGSSSSGTSSSQSPGLTPKNS